jgi:vault protein inter-alpha-trypsin-like protein/PEP-CTERM motif-containing protein
MISWTTPAKEEVDSYLNNVRASIATSGADASEVIDDLKRHIEEEIHTAHLETVTRDDVRRIVHRLGVPETGGVALAEPPKAPPKVDTRNGHHAPFPRSSRPHAVVLVFGVILPLVTLAIEFFTHFCASAFFDPIPSYWHVLAVAAVPVCNMILWRALRSGSERHWRVLAWCNAIVAGIALFYTFRYVLLLAPAVIALIFFGMGLLPMTPLLSFIATLRLRSRLKHISPSPGWNLTLGMFIGFLLVAAIDIPVMISYAGMSMANSESPRTRAKGIRMLRVFGNEQAMLRACYGRARAANEMDAYSLLFAHPVTPEVAREVYYRVHGQPFNAVPPPAVFTTQGRWTAAEREFTWDNDQGGEAVAGRIKGLSLANSRLDGLIDSEGAVGYVEWTLEFSNISPLQREARALIALPPGGAVSRLTLWVNNEEREAAFAGRGEVRAAYQRVVSARRDPVLVTSAGPDRVLMQCFPIAPDGGTMKVRLGITAPMEILDDKNALLTAPCFVERNFTIPEDFRHSIWLESKQALSAAGLSSGRAAEGAFTLRGEMGDLAFSALKVSRDRAWATTVASDPRRTGHFVRQSITPIAARPVEQAYFVVDTSVSMERHLGQIAEGLKSLPANVQATLLLPDDEDVDVFVPENLQALIGRVYRISSAGGKDNVPALLRAWDMAGSNANGIVVWIHGAQPSPSRSFEHFKQRLDWHANAANIIDVPVEAAPNRLFEKLEGAPAIRTLARSRSLSTDLGRLFASWSPGAKAFQITRESLSEQGPDVRSSSHVVRLWAYEQIQQFIRRRHTTGAVELAGLYQLVTPVSGAVVLETQQQFQQAGLNPVDASSVPTVPEPGTWILLAVALLALWVHRKFFPRTARTGK